jgi:hypothetical protein
MMRRSIGSSGRLSLPAAALAIALVGCGDSSNPQPYSGTDSGRPKIADGGSNPGNGLTVSGSSNVLVLQSCGAAPATQNLSAGTFTISLSASTLSKGTVANGQATSNDPYVLVHANDSNTSHRFFMLNGVGSSASFTLSSGGAVQVMFVDSDPSGNSGTATVDIQPGGFQLTVDATANVMAWKTACNSSPASRDFDAGSYTYTLASSTLSAGGPKDDNVLVRTPSEDPDGTDRYVVLDGVGNSKSVSFAASSGTLYAWALGVSAPPSGQAVVNIK